MRHCTRREALAGLGAAAAGLTMSALPWRPASAQDISAQALRTAYSVPAKQREVLAGFQVSSGVGQIAASEIPLDRAPVEAPSGAFDCWEMDAQGIATLRQSIEPLPVSSLRHWADVHPLFKRPRATWPTSAQPAGQIWANESELLLVPVLFGLDAPAFRPDLVEAEDADTWTALFDPRFKGKAALIDEATTAIGEVVLALNAKGELEAEDPGNPSVEEIDRAIDWLIELKKAGQFHSLWHDPRKLVPLMAEGSVVIADAWEATIFEVRRLGFACESAVPREGYRGWVFGVSKLKETPNGAAVRAYLDYWLSGPPGALAASEGYYSTSDTVKNVLSPEFYNYLYEGHPWVGPSELGIQEGSIRRGGTLDERVRHCRFWGQRPEANAHLQARWEEFRTA